MSVRILAGLKMRPVHAAWAALSAALVLVGCETMSPEQQAAQDDATCRSYGAEVGSDAYVQCRMTQVQERYARRQAIAASLSAMGGAMRDQPSAPQSTLAGGGMTCFKQGEVTSGVNKICTYNCAGSAAAITQGAVSLCPLTINR